MDGKANIYDIARLTGTTIAAVSRAFDPKGKIEQSKREAILKAAEKYGYRPNRAAGRLSGKAIKIGCLLIANIPEYYEELVAGIKNSCAKLSDFKVECDIRLVPPDENGDRVVAAAFEEYLRGGADGVITNIKYTAEAVRYISLLSDAGIPCATVTSDAPESRRLFSVQNDFVTAGRMAAQLLSLAGATGSVLLFTGERDSYVQRHIISGFSEEAAEDGLSVIGTYDTSDDPDLAAEYAERAFSEHPDCAGIYISTANSLPVIGYMKKHGLAGKVKIIASDVFPGLSEYIKDCTVTATVYQNPYGQAKTAFEKLYDHITFKKPEKQIFTVVPQVVMKSNLHLYERNSQ